MLSIEYSSVPTVLSFFNEDLVRTIEVCIPADPHGEQQFSVTINVENSMASLPHFSCALHA